MERAHSHLNRLVETLVHKDVLPMLKITTTVEVDLGIPPDNVTKQVLLNLRRGWCSAISGQAIQLYRILSTKYQIPMFAVGRGGDVVISSRLSTKEEVLDLVKSYQAMWNIGHTPATPGYYNPGFYSHVSRHHADQWWEVYMTRTPAQNIHGVLSMMGVKSIWDVVPQEATLAATAAILRKEVFTINHD